MKTKIDELKKASTLINQNTIPPMHVTILKANSTGEVRFDIIPKLLDIIELQHKAIDYASDDMVSNRLHKLLKEIIEETTEMIEGIEL